MNKSPVKIYFLMLTLSVLIIPVFIIPVVNAEIFSSKDIKFSLNQEEYYFKTGENAIINLSSKNSYGEKINGLLSYTIAQSINQGNIKYSSSNTQSTSFSVEDGNKEIPLNFGTTNSPETLSVNLKFSYTENNKAMEVVLNGLKIHFVSDDSQKNNQQKKISSSSQQAKPSQQQNSQQSDPFSQQKERMQQLINQMTGNNQQQTSDSQKALENNQMAQDSSALKQQMENQIKEQQEMKKEFQKQLAQNQKFQKEHQKLLRQGYNLTDATFDPSSNNTGDFKLNYQKQNGEQASLKGQMKNGTIENLQKNTAESRRQILNQLEQNKQFQKYQKQLKNQGFKQQNNEFSLEENKTKVKIDYMNQNNETAMIQAEAVNNTIQNVKLKKNNKKENKNYLWILFVLTLLGIMSYFIYKKFNKKTKQEREKITIKKKIEKPFDYKNASLKILEKAKKLFDKKQYKDAYGKAGQALRLYLSYENDLRKETTNDEIINHLIKHKKKHNNIKNCFDLCSLVEFAKYQANKKDFEKIVVSANKIINNSK